MIIGVILLSINIFGIIFPTDYRNNKKIIEISKENNEIKRRIINKVVKNENPIFLISYKNSLKYIDKSYKQFGKSYEFINFAAKVWHNSIVYSNEPKELKPIKFTQNWFFFIITNFEYLKYKIGFKNYYKQFNELQTNNYKIALRRTFGICSQSALAFSDLLKKKYNINSYVVGLGGHVILEIEINKKKFISDPSMGISYNFNINDVYKNQKLYEKIIEDYKIRNFESAGIAYNQKGNRKTKLPGAKIFNPNPYETISEYLKWSLPLILILMSFILSKKKHRLKKN